MSQIQGLAIESRTAKDAVGVALLRLLVAVVAFLAQALQVVVVEEQTDVAPVRTDVINHRRRHQLPQRFVHATQRVGAQLLSPEPAPSCTVVKIVVFGHCKKQTPVICSMPGLGVVRVSCAGINSVPEM